MAFDYIGLSNEVLRAFNEVPFTDATAFSAAVGSDQFVKDSINNVLADIYNEGGHKWSWQHTQGTQVLTVGTTAYSAPSGTRSTDFNSFYIDKVYGDEDDFTSVTANSGAKTFTIAAGSCITAGFAVGMVVQWGDLSEADNNDTDFTINTITATVMTVDETVTTISSADTAFCVTNAAGTPDFQKLSTIPKDVYNQFHLDKVSNAKETSNYTKPWFVVRELDNSYIFGPIKPDKTYLVKFDYYAGLTKLSASTDVPAIPEIYETVILDGVKQRVAEFRENDTMTANYKQLYKTGVDQMVLDLIPTADTLRYGP